MVCCETVEHSIVVGSVFTVAHRWLNLVTDAYFVRDDIYSIEETITSTATGAVVSRTLDKASVVFDALQSSPAILGGHYQYNIRVVVPADVITAAGRYTYQLTIVPDGNGAADEENTQKTNGIVLVAK